MLKITPTRETTWTAADLVERFGPIPLSRICHEPPPGCATEDDLFAREADDDRLYELIDGTLLEKTMGNVETLLAAWLIRILDTYVLEHDLGLVTAPDGRFRMEPEQIRLPDVAFISWNRLPGGKVPLGSAFDCGCDLAIEVISPGNTPREMETKLEEYFAAGTRLVWYVYPDDRSVHAFTSPADTTVIAETETLSGGEVLPGFELPLRELFARLPAGADEEE